MTKLVVFAVLISLFTQCTNNSVKINNTVMDNITGEEIIIGKCNSEIFAIHPFNQWFTSEYNSYSPNMATLDSLKTLSLKNIQIVAVVGSWCGDTHRELPRFIKITNQSKLQKIETVIIAVDYKKMAPDCGIDTLNITKIPVFIFYRNNSEIGRITEAPHKNLESDIIAILK